MITKDTIKHIAKLAHIDVTDKELPKLTTELEQIINYVDSLNELNLDNINPTAHAVDVNNVFRDDVVKKSDVIKSVLENAPESDDEFFRVPKVL